MISRRVFGSVVLLALVVVVGGVAYAGQPAANGDMSTAIVVAGYLAFPMLALLAIGLLLIALLLVVAHAMERNREVGVRHLDE